MQYDSLQAYLEEQLKVATNITPELIAQLKREWRKDYVARYNTTYRDDHVQITFRLSKKQYAKLTQLAQQQQQKPTVYCRMLTVNTINGTTPHDVQPIKLSLMKIIDSVEEAQFEGKSLDLDTLLSELNTMLEALL